MNVQHLSAKIFARDSQALDLEPVLGIFNGWIQQSGSEELLIDVADYRHVFHGPGVVLIGHEANYSLDETGGRLGLLYSRKAPLDGSVQDRLRQAVRAALRACRRLEEEPVLSGRLAFDGRAIELLVNDRALVPNTQLAFAALEPEVRTLADAFYGPGAYSLERNSDPRERFNVQVRATGSDPDVEGLLEALA